jgi:hypothetical protein
MTDAELDQAKRDASFLRSLVGSQPKLKRSGQDWVCCCPLHTEKSASFTMYADGHFHCYGCGANGTCVDYVMARDKVDVGEAIQRIARERGVDPQQPKKPKEGNGVRLEKWHPMVPPPANAGRPPAHMLRNCIPFEYVDANGHLLFYQRRFDKPDDDKEMLPLTYGTLTKDGHTVTGWHSKGPSRPVPLYRLDRLTTADPDSHVIVVEGEGKCQAAERMFPDYVVTSWMNGANSVPHSGWSPLKRFREDHLIWWPDADKPKADGKPHGCFVASPEFRKLFPKTLSVDTTGLDDIKNGFDAVDLERLPDVNDYEAWLKARIRHPSLTDFPGNQTWTEPVDLFAFSDIAPPNVTEADVPAAIWPFVHDTAERMGVARSSVALSAIVSCSGAISDEWCVQPKQNDTEWTENARLWGALVGPPSILKTPIIKAATRPLDLLEMHHEQQWQEEMETYELQLAAWQEAKDAAKKAKCRFDDPKPHRPRKPRFIVESTTIEALQEVLRSDGEARYDAPAKKVLSRQDELSEWLANLDRYSGGRGGGDRGAYLRLWNGGRYSVDRIGRGSFSSNHWSACLLGGIQPEPIQQIAKHSVDDGLLQRFLFDVPPPEPGEGQDRTPSYAAIDRYNALFPALAALHPPRNERGYPEAVHLHRDAQQHRQNVEIQARAISSMPDTSRQLRSALGKWSGYFARLCLTFHLIEIADARAKGDIGPPLAIISADTAARVECYMCDVLLPHLLRAYAVMFATTQTGHAAWVAGHILANSLDRITVRDIMRGYSALSSPEARAEIDSVMASLVAVGWLDPEPSRNALTPVSAWRVNPVVHERYAARAEQERAERKRRAEEVVAVRKAAAARKAQRAKAA